MSAKREGCCSGRAGCVSIWISVGSFVPGSYHSGGGLTRRVRADECPVSSTKCQPATYIGRYTQNSVHYAGNSLRRAQDGSPHSSEGTVRGRDLLSISELTPDELELILRTALSMKRDGGGHDLLRNKTLALIFEKPSLRTRVSFDVAMQALGGHAIYLSQAEVGLGQREPVADVARVLSRYVDVIAARTYSHDTLPDLARHASVPVINALSDEEHPCQAMADVLTILERFGSPPGVRLAFVG